MMSLPALSLLCGPLLLCGLLMPALPTADAWLYSSLRARLVNGTRTSNGRLEVYKNRQWGTVCDDSFDVNDARVACRMLGYRGPTPVVRRSDYYGPGSGSIQMDEVRCAGTESNLDQCNYTTSHNCVHEEDVGIDCAPNQFRARLVNGLRSSEGRLEVSRDGGPWGTVCDDSFTVEDAKVACRMLGYYGVQPIVRSGASYGPGTGSILMDNVDCHGTESTLGHCSYVTSHNCGHSEDVGIDCRPAVSSARLVGGSRSSEGRLEVLIDGRWGTVCDDGFDVNDARVACRMLGLSSSRAPIVRSSAYYGQGSGDILMDDVMCAGNETNLGYCGFRGSRYDNCHHGEDVGIDCQPRVSVSRVRLVNGRRTSEGRLEVYGNYQWGTVCDDYFSVADARVACRMLGYHGVEPLVRGGAAYGQGSGSILMDDVRCSGSETNFSQCSYSSDHNCRHSEDVGIDCRPVVSNARLVDGSRPSEGRLEVMINGRWGTVCDDGFGVDDAKVACRMLGYSGSDNPVVRSSAYYGPGYGDTLMDDVGCLGNETSFSQCSFVNGDNENCSHSEDVGIVCQ